MSKYNELDYVCALDLETTGLDEQGDSVLEVAARFGRIDFDGWHESGLYCDAVLGLRSDVRTWHPRVVEMHARNGLLVDSALVVNAGRDAAWCDTELTDLAESYLSRLPVDGAKITLLGNSVHFDLRFVRRLFPKFTKLLSHRVIDVSAIRLFCQSMGMPKPEGEAAHRAMPDVDESLRLFGAFRAWVRDSGYEGQL